MATLYFTGSNWNNLGSWYQNNARTIAATSFPTINDDVDVILTDNITMSSPTTVNSAIIRTTDNALRIFNIPLTTIGEMKFLGVSRGSSRGNILITPNITRPNCTITAGSLVLTQAQIGGASTNITDASININTNSITLLEGAGIETHRYNITLNDNCYILLDAAATDVNSYNSARIGDTSFNTRIYGNNFSIVVNKFNSLVSFYRSVFNSDNHNLTLNDSSFFVCRSRTNFNSVIVNGTPFTTLNGTYSRFEDVGGDGGFGTSSGTTINNDAALVCKVYGNVTFNNNSKNLGIINGNATFNNNAKNAGLNYNNNSSLGTVTGTAAFTNSNYSIADMGESLFGNITLLIFSSTTPITFTAYGTDTFSGNTTSWTFGANPIWNFTENSYNLGTINKGTVNYNGLTGTNQYGVFTGGRKTSAIGIPITVTDSAIFTNDSVLGFNGSITGNVIFRKKARNLSSISGSVTLDYDKGVNGSSILGIV
jgi:hypothetical protein